MRDYAPKPSWPLKVNSVVVLAMSATLCVLFAAATVASLFKPRGAYAFIGGLMLTPMLAVFAVFVFCSVFRRSPTATGVATALYFIGSGFMVFGVVANIGEAIVEGDECDIGLLLAIAGIGLGIAAYAAFGAILSLRWGRCLRESAANHRVQTDAVVSGDGGEDG